MTSAELTNHFKFESSKQGTLDMQKSLENQPMLRSLLLDFLLIVALAIPVIICEYGIEPTRRGFFCNDDSIKYPYRANTVGVEALVLLVLVLPLMLIVLVEFVLWCGGGDSSQGLLVQWRAPSWLLQCATQYAYYMIGFLMATDVQEVGKFSIGRLRPHFRAVCQPQLLDGSWCGDSGADARYIEDYECAASDYTANVVRQARLSFPSGHATSTWYAMLYLALYLQKRMTWHGSRLACHTLQFVLLTTAWYVSLTRISDYWHHWSDVLVGTLIGCVTALLTAIYIAKLFVVEHVGARVSRCDLKLRLPLPLPQQTNAGDMLHQVVATTTQAPYH